MIVGLCQGRKTALTLVVTFYTTHSDRFNFSVHKLWNNAYLRIALVISSAGILLLKQLSSDIDV